jgi:predicted  nucleic acid-binding Zn-ribbon protein
MGRKPIHTYVPNEFGTLSKEERRIRGEMSTILRMKKRREEKILKLKEEISLIEKDIQKVDTKFKKLIKEMNTKGFQFPKFGLILELNQTKTIEK